MAKKKVKQKYDFTMLGCRDTFTGSLFVYLLLGIFPLVVTKGYTNITATKMTSYLVILAFCAACWFFEFMFVPKRLVSHEAAQWVKKGWAWRLPDVMVTLFMLAGVMAWLVSPYFGDATSEGKSVVLIGASRFDGLFYWASYALIYFLASRYARFKSEHLIFFGFVAFVIVTISIFQLCGFNFLELYPAGAYSGWHNNFFGTIGNADVMAGFMCMATPIIGVGYIVYKWKFEMSAFFLIINTACVYLMLWMGVDMALVGLVCVMAFMTPLLLRNKEYTKRTLDVGISIATAWMLTDTVVFQFDPGTTFAAGFGKTFFMGLAAVLVLLGLRLVVTFCKFADKLPYKWFGLGVIVLEVLGLIAVFCYFWMIEEPAKNGLMKDLWQLFHWQLEDTAGHNRIGTWRCALAMGFENFWFGTGTGTFPLEFKEFAKEFGYTRYADKNLDFAHNDYIHLFCTTGIFGIVSYLGFLGSCAWSGLKNMMRNPRVLILGAAAFGYIVQVFFCFSIVLVTPIFWLILGLLVGESRDIFTAKQVKELTPFIVE